MTRKPERKSLGRGLSALLGDIDPAPDLGAASSEVVQSADELPLDLIHPNPDQPRQRFSAEALEELAASIAEHGVIQPLVLRPHPEKQGEYQIVAGERRWRAAQSAGLHKIPAVVRALDDQTVVEVAIIENVQRQDLSPIEEAAGYQALIDRFDYTQESLARVVGKSRSHVANMLRLLGLPDSIKDALAAGEFSAGHARALLTADDPTSLARRISKEGLSVRQVEALSKSNGARAQNNPQKSPSKDADTRILEGDLSAAIGMRATLVPGVDGAGELRIRYRDFEELERLCEKLTQ